MSKIRRAGVGYQIHILELIFLFCAYFKQNGSNISFMQLKVVGPVAVFGGLLQIVMFMFLSGLTAMVWCRSLWFGFATCLKW